MTVTVRAGGHLGLDPTDVGFDIILLVGQSNIVGQNVDIDTTNFDVGGDSRIWSYGNSGSFANRMVVARDPLAHHSTVTPAQVGPGMALTRDYLRIVRPNRKVVLLPCGHGGTNFHTTIPTIWDPDSPTGLYANSIAQYEGLLTVVGPNSRLVMIVWCQGESSAQPAEFDNYDYETDLDGLIDQYRIDLPLVPFCILQMNPDNIEDDTDGNAAARQAINAVHVDTPRRKLLTSFTYGAVGYQYAALPSHYTAAGQRINGANLVRGFQRAVENVLGTDPEVPGAPTLVQSGTTLTATLDHPGGRITDMSFRYRVVGAGSWTALTRTQSIDLIATITGITPGQIYEAQVAAVNEEGQSAWGAAGTIATVTAPAKVTGLTVGTVGTSAPLAWGAAARADYYRMEFKPSAGSDWLSAGTTTSLSGNVAALAELTAYDFRVVAVNAAGDGPASDTASDTTPTLQRLIGGAVAGAAFEAYSIARNLRSAYTGALIRVRRSSDNTEQDIGSTSGVLNQAALTTFCGAGDGFVTKIYDQSGNGRDLAQATAGSQPQIVGSGTVFTQNGIPTMVFDGTDDYLVGAFSGLFAAGACTIEGVLAGSPTVNNVRVFGEGSNTGNSIYIPVMHVGTTGKLGTFLRNSSNVTVIAQTGLPAAVFLDTTAHQVSVVDNGSGSTVDRRVDGGTVSSIDSARSGSVILNETVLGAQVLSSGATIFYNGNVSELVAWSSALGSSDRFAAENNQRSFFATL